MDSDLDQIQELIDHLFARLADAGDGGRVNQLVHALRLQITRKRALGGRLDAREEAILAHRPDDDVRRRMPWGRILVLLIIIAILAGIAWWVWRRLIG